MATLQQIEAVPSQNYLSIFWNDEPPDIPDPSLTYAHAKGALAMDLDQKGFILIHSSPNFVEIVN